MVAASPGKSCLLYTSLNIAVVTNSLPNTGVILPFISYGGTSIIFLMAEIGLVLSVSRGIRLENVDVYKRQIQIRSNVTQQMNEVAALESRINDMKADNDARYKQKMCIRDSYGTYHNDSCTNTAYYHRNSCMGNEEKEVDYR